ncbi:MAG: glucans biosynthesis glucosyltransferase MdoH [Alphaproteobacteria bacterium]|nr:glucans biosynthesis glucosyltransferase MdoH [Alphaproteobacteria bacterium]
MDLRPRKRAGRASRILVRRRVIVAALNIVTVIALTAAMAGILAHGGWSATKLAMILAFFVTLPWLSIGFWNAVIGFSIARFAAAAGHDPFHLAANPEAPISSRIAIAMAIRNEDPGAAVRRLRAIAEDIEAAGLIACFDMHLLSDTNIEEVARAEEELVAGWRASVGYSRHIHYRRRTNNQGYKAGNIEEFCERAGDCYDFFLPLDADSFMSASAIVELVRIMQDNPRIGILQSLVVGLPAKSLFTRAFQFGMRHGMRTYTAGSQWWQVDCGPYWGHNALIRMAPFRDHCKLPVLPGEGPLDGHVMSHDQVEAVLMRRAGYHVRVLSKEGESFEENPPTLPDFIRRELRWCQGNLQYLKLLGMDGLHPMSRLQLALAILMYLGAVGWMAFIALGVAEILANGYVEGYPVAQGAALFATILAMSLMPKLMGLAGVLGDRRQSQRYGGRARVIAGGGLELVFSALIAPIVSFAIALFTVGLGFGKKLRWSAQERTVRSVSWREACSLFLPQTLTGLGIGVLLYIHAPLVLPWAAPVIAGFVLSIPVAALTASHRSGCWSRRCGLFDIPEDVARMDVLQGLDNGSETFKPANKSCSGEAAIVAAE